MNEFLFRIAIEESQDRTGWADLVNRADTAWRCGDWSELRRVAETALRRRPCIEWQVRLRMLLAEFERTGP